MNFEKSALPPQGGLLRFFAKQKPVRMNIELVDAIDPAANAAGSSGQISIAYICHKVLLKAFFSVSPYLSLRA